jgi:hypothetical protein
MFLFITFTQSFKNVTMVIFLELFGYEHFSNKVLGGFFFVNVII